MNKNKGFTLVELLAVITIMGILMIVAIGSVNRIIENSRRDTFATTAKEYVNTIRNAVLADNISCTLSSGETVASATPDGVYYFPIDTLQQGTKDLMEDGGKSSFGNAEIKGYVKWVKETDNSDEYNPKTTTKYTIYITDTGKHGLDTEMSASEIRRAKINTNVTTPAPDKPTDTNAIPCALN